MVKHKFIILFAWLLITAQCVSLFSLNVRADGNKSRSGSMDSSFTYTIPRVKITVTHEYWQKTSSGLKLVDSKSIHYVHKLGDNYKYFADQTRDGYDVEGDSVHEGTIDTEGDFTLTFKYVEDKSKPENPGESGPNSKKETDDKSDSKPQQADDNSGKTDKNCTVTVIDKYITMFPTDQYVSDEPDDFNTYKYIDENGQYVYLVIRELRCIDTYKRNSEYAYDALKVEDFECISAERIAGIVREDIEIEFIYINRRVSARDIPDDVYRAKPDYPYAPEAKTGDLDENIPYVLCITAVCVIAIAIAINRKKIAGIIKKSKGSSL